MKFSDLFYSPSLKQFRDIAHLNSGNIGILIEYKEKKNNNTETVVYIAKNMTGLKKKIRELHNMQVTLGLKIGVNEKNIDKTKAYLIFKPLNTKFTIHDNFIQVANSKKTYPIKTSRWVRDKKTGFNF